MPKPATSPDRRVDVIVVGAGLGGLSAATSLAKQGMEVLLLERHNVPGGYATSFVRGRYEFEVALHELSGVGTPERPGALYRYLDELGVARRIEIMSTPTLYRSVFPDLDLTLPSGWGPFEQVLADAFPQDARGLARFCEILRQVYGDLGKLRKAGMGRMASPWYKMQFPLRYPTMFRYHHATYWPVLARHVKDHRARGALSQLWGYFGLPPGRCSFMFFALGVASYAKHGAAYVRGRSQALSNAFVAACEEHGGSVRLGCGVDRILVEDGKVTGVITDQGERIAADWVVSNADPITTCRDLIGRDSVPAAFFHSLQPFTVATSTVNVYLGVARTAAELGITDHELFINADHDFEGHFQKSKGLEPPGAVVMTCYNHVAPDISPPGTSMVVLTSPSFGRAWHGVGPQEYVDVKHRIGEAMLTAACQHVPDLRRYAEVIEVSTPLTNMRYAGAPGGSIYGYDNDPGRHTMWRMRQLGPVRGLLFVGAWTQPGGGFEPVMVSGRGAAKAIVKRAGRRPEEAA